jgi:hypothetical protein
LVFVSAANKLAVVDVQALPVRHFRSRRFWIVSTLVALGVAVVAVLIAGYAWLESYAPLEQGSSWGGVSGAEGVTVSPLGASGGVDVAFPRYRPQGRFHIRVSVANRGRLGVTVLGVAEASGEDFPFVPTKVQVSPLNDFGAHVRVLDGDHPVRIAPGEERTVTITYRIAAHCLGGQPRRYWTGPANGTSAVSDTVTMRIRYARWFERSQTVRMPLAVALVCARGVQPSPSR